jgi:hypothetical protein
MPSRTFRVLLPVLTAVGLPMPALAQQPQAYLQHNAHLVVIRTVATDDTEYRCNYSFSATFYGYKSAYTYSGQTDPPTNSQNAVVSQWPFQRWYVTGATLTYWNCVPVD